MKNIISRLAAYLFVPLIFTLVGCGVIFLAVQQPLNKLSAAVSMFIGEQPPEFEKEQQPLEVSAANVSRPLHGAFYANMYCERFGYSGKIYYGDSIRILKKGIGQREGSALVGYPGITMLYGHNDGAFWFLETLEEGNVIEIDTAYGKYEYRVKAVKVGYGDNDAELYPKENGTDQLVMCTEYPFKSNKKTVEDVPKDDVEEGTHKIIWAEKISGPLVLE